MRWKKSGKNQEKGKIKERNPARHMVRRSPYCIARTRASRPSLLHGHGPPTPPSGAPPWPMWAATIEHHRTARPGTTQSDHQTALHPPLPIWWNFNHHPPRAPFVRCMAGGCRHPPRPMWAVTTKYHGTTRPPMTHADI